MGSNCCKNALDKVRPPAHTGSSDAGEPPDPAAPWPGDTFCRAPATQAPPAFPEGAFDSLLPENQLQNTSLQRKSRAGNAEVLSGGNDIERRISAPAGSGSTAVSLPAYHGQHQRSSRMSRYGQSARRPTAHTGEDTFLNGSSHHQGTGFAAAAGEGDGSPFDDSIAQGAQPLSARLRQAIRSSSRSLRSRLRRRASGTKLDGAGRSDSGNEGGGKAFPCTGERITSFPGAGVDDTHFVCYPPVSTPSSESLSQGWPAAAPPWDVLTAVPAVGGDESATANGARGRCAGTSQYTSGISVMAALPSRGTPALPPAFPSGVELTTDISGDKAEACEQVGIAQDMNIRPPERRGESGAEKKRFPVENTVASPAPSRQQPGKSVTTVKNKKSFLTRRRGSGAASSFRAAVEVALPRWKGSRGPGGAEKKDTRNGGGGVVTGNTRGGGVEEGKKVKRRKKLMFPGELRRAVYKGRNKRKTGTSDADRAALRSSHCSSASTAAQEEDENTTMGAEYWWAPNTPSQQAAQDFTPELYADSQVANNFPFRSGQSSSQQPGVSSIVWSEPQQLASEAVVSHATTTRVTGAPAQQPSQGGPLTVGRIPALPEVTFVGGGNEQAGHRIATPPLLDPTLSPQHGSNNAAGGHVPVYADEAGTGENEDTGRLHPQQAVMHNRRIEPNTSSTAGQDASDYGSYREYTGVTISSSSPNTGNISSNNAQGNSPGARTERDASPAAPAASGGNSRGGEAVMEGVPPWTATETSVITSVLGLAINERTAQQAPADGDRRKGAERDALNATSGNDSHTPIITMPFPE